MRRQLLWSLVALLAVGAACGGAGTKRGIGPLIDPKAKAEGIIVRPDFKPVDLNGLGKPTKLSGACFDEYVVLPAGEDNAKVQQFILSFHLKGDPKDEFALFNFLGKNKCGRQQGDVFDHVVKTLGLTPTDPNMKPPVEISYRTTSGRRLFL